MALTTPTSALVVFVVLYSFSTRPFMTFFSAGERESPANQQAASGRS